MIQLQRLNDKVDVMRIKDLTGQKFGKLTAVEFSYKDGGNNAMWKFKCDCGNDIVIRGSEVSRGATNSCGCLKAINSKLSNTKHNLARSKVYKTWINMKARCFNENDINFNDYGARGIAVCTRWLVFENFLEDMGQPKKGESLDRIDNNKGYSKDNCRWATNKEQIRNRSTSRIITIDGVDYESISVASEELGLTVSTIRGRCNSDNYSNYSQRYKYEEIK